LFKALDKKRKEPATERDNNIEDEVKKAKLNNIANPGPVPVTHDTHYWKFKSVMKTQNNAREAVKVFKVHPRRNKRDEMIADVEAKVNADRKGLTPDGLRFGSMLPKKV
jgi:hypothetical protein